MFRDPDLGTALRLQWAGLVLLALLGTLPFWFSDLDLWAAAYFHAPGADDPWPIAHHPLWVLLYHLAPALTGLLLLGALLVLVAGTRWPRASRLRPAAWFLIAATLLGPGLVVNAVFKDHWGRPRPHQVEALGGQLDYLPPLARGESGQGKSFPCGHSSVGFLLGVFFLLWYPHRRRLAWAALAAAILLGTLLGIGRMAAGDHFLSDVIWSAVMVHAVALALYPWFRRQAARAAATAGAPREPVGHQRPWLAGIGYGSFALLLTFGVLLATPLKQVTQDGLDLAPSPALQRLSITADQAMIDLIWDPDLERAGWVRLQARGFGLPWSRVEKRLDREADSIHYRLEHRGLFSERDTRLLIRLHPHAWSQVSLRTDAGSIREHGHPGGQTRVELNSPSARGQRSRDDAH